MGLLKAVMRLSMTSLKGADAKEIASSVTAIANEKIKAEKEATAGKKKTGGKLMFADWTFIGSCFDMVRGVKVNKNKFSFLQVQRRNNCMLIKMKTLLEMHTMMPMTTMISCENWGKVYLSATCFDPSRRI